MASKFRFRTIWFQKGHENDSMQKINFNGPNFLWKFLGVSGIHRLITIIILFTNFTKPYSSQPKMRRLRFGTFWRFITFNLAKLFLKAETSRMEMDFWKKFSHFALQGKNFWNYGFMVDTQTLLATMPSFSYITCIKRNCLLLSGGASQEREA